MKSFYFEFYYDLKIQYIVAMNIRKQQKVE